MISMLKSVFLWTEGVVLGLNKFFVLCYLCRVSDNEEKITSLQSALNQANNECERLKHKVCNYSPTIIGAFIMMFVGK